MRLTFIPTDEPRVMSIEDKINEYGVWEVTVHFSKDTSLEALVSFLNQHPVLKGNVQMSILPKTT